MRRTVRASADEASAMGINWTFSPMVDVCRDARWGRIMEGGGEDPYLNSLIAKAKVEGYQRKNLKEMGALHVQNILQRMEQRLTEETIIRLILVM